MQEERKKVKEEMKIKKQNRKEGNAKSPRKKIKESTNTCKMSSNPTKTSNRLSCDMCSSLFHVKCVPYKHQQFVPEDVSMDHYVCHVCNSKVNNDDDDDISLKERTDDEENNTVEDLEADMLIDMYKENKL
ncbi:hypothetical protein HHI36_008166 [Cryptolaemus montrouzieri]|uniref:Zinc finger PHD-type domain-containing protein n=1 Tax=Cryptolaemus montrouzieri TaxID=559131 RepID=A0ABD2MRU0_9CUCU